MTMNMQERETLQKLLMQKRICRFCLKQDKLTNIFARNAQESVSLPIQIMACVSIEVFPDDGMPMWICKDCRGVFEHSYRFKQMCKEADTLLRQFPLTGQWPCPLERPRLPQTESVQTKVDASTLTATLTGSYFSTQPTKPKSPIGTKKILNSSPAASPEPPIPKRGGMQKDSLKLDRNLDEILMKVDMEEEISMDDVQRLIANINDDDSEYETPVVINAAVSPKKAPPKILNKASIRLHNKEANIVVEPKLSQPELKLDDNGTVSIVTAILDPSEVQEAPEDPTKNVVPVATDVYPCPHCDRSFPLLQLRDIHMVNHNRERRFPCNVCQKSFFSKYDLQKHEVRHTDDKPFACLVCKKKFSRATLLHRHERTHTDIPKFICVFCEKAFISKDEMERHTQRHQRNRPFECRTCNKAFAFKQGLERHEVVHSAVQPYPCQYCDQSFPTPSKLARHLTAHAGKRPYPCKYCNKSYVLSHHLTRHLRSHKQVKSEHVCTICQSKFKQREDLIYHTALHATANLCCTLCHKDFSTADEVYDHIKQHADGESYACEFCDLLFIKAQELEDHCNEKHIEDMEAYNDDGGIIIINEKQDTRPAEQELEKTLEEMFTERSSSKIPIDDDEENAQEFLLEDLKTSSKKPLLEKPKVLNQLVLKSIKNDEYQENEGNPKKILTAQKQSGKDVRPSNSKMRKVVSLDGQVKSVASKSSERSPPIPRRKEVALVKEIKVEIKTEENSNLPTNVEQILPKLPKGVTLRRTINENQNQTPISSLALKSSAQGELKASKEKPSTSPKNNVFKTSSEVKTSPRNSGPASSKSPQKAKLTKGKLTRTNRVAVEASSKQSRIRLKNGNMSLVASARGSK